MPRVETLPETELSNQRAPSTPRSANVLLPHSIEDFPVDLIWLVLLFYNQSPVAIMLSTVQVALKMRSIVKVSHVSSSIRSSVQVVLIQRLIILSQIFDWNYLIPSGVCHAVFCWKEITTTAAGVQWFILWWLITSGRWFDGNSVPWRWSRHNYGGHNVSQDIIGVKWRLFCSWNLGTVVVMVLRYCVLEHCGACQPSPSSVPYILLILSWPLLCSFSFSTLWVPEPDTFLAFCFVSAGFTYHPPLKWPQKYSKIPDDALCSTYAVTLVQTRQWPCKGFHDNTHVWVTRRTLT